MWDWINCHLAGRHEYAVWSDSNRMFLRCLRCGRRSNGWDVATNNDDNGHPVHRPGDNGRTRHSLVAGMLSLIGLTHIGR